jgi:hypothetical protein
LLVSLGSQGYTFGQLYENDSTFTFKNRTAATTSITLGGPSENITVASDSTTVQTELFTNKLNFINTSETSSFLSQDSTNFYLNSGGLTGIFQGPRWHHLDSTGEKLNNGLGFQNSKVIGDTQTVPYVVANWNDVSSIFTILILSTADGNRNITFPVLTLTSGSEYQTVGIINCSTTDWTVTANNDIYGHATTAATTYVIPHHQTNNSNHITFRSIKTGISTYAWIAF